MRPAVPTFVATFVEPFVGDGEGRLRDRQSLRQWIRRRRWSQIRRHSFSCREISSGLNPHPRPLPLLGGGGTAGYCGLRRTSRPVGPLFGLSFFFSFLLLVSSYSAFLATDTPTARHLR